MSGTLEKDRKSAPVVTPKNSDPISIETIHHPANHKSSLVQEKVQRFRYLFQMS